MLRHYLLNHDYEVVDNFVRRGLMVHNVGIARAYTHFNLYPNRNEAVIMNVDHYIVFNGVIYHKTYTDFNDIYNGAFFTLEADLETFQEVYG